MGTPSPAPAASVTGGHPPAPTGGLSQAPLGPGLQGDFGGSGGGFAASAALLAPGGPRTGPHPSLWAVLLRFILARRADFVKGAPRPAAWGRPLFRRLFFLPVSSSGAVTQALLGPAPFSKDKNPAERLFQPFRGDALQCLRPDGRGELRPCRGPSIGCAAYQHGEWSLAGGTVISSNYPASHSRFRSRSYCRSRNCSRSRSCCRSCFHNCFHSCSHNRFRSCLCSHSCLRSRSYFCSRNYFRIRKRPAISTANNTSPHPPSLQLMSNGGDR